MKSSRKQVSIHYLPTRINFWVARERVTKVIAIAHERRNTVLRYVLQEGIRATHEVVQC